MPASRLDLTDRDRDLLRTLSHCVRAFAVPQVARFWWPKSTNASTPLARLKQLAIADYLSLESQHVEPPVRLTDPLACWQPGCPPPDFATIASTAQRRWNRPPVTVPCIVATPRAAAQFGGRGGHPPRPTEWTHDLHLAQVYLRMRVEFPTRTASWVHEDLVQTPGDTRPSGEKVPDAYVTDGLHQTAIELVGSSYTRSKLEGFHEFCDAKAFAYELW